MITLEAAKGNFFDRDVVKDAMDKATYKNLNEFGRMVRKTAQKSLVYDEKPSLVGRPPHAHKTGRKETTSKSTGKTRVRAVSPLREFLYYSYDSSSRTVVIGPVLLSNAISRTALPALEYGGRSIVNQQGRHVAVSIRPRPFMKPALTSQQAHLPSLWKDSIGK